jgi:hypothetical protein
MNASYVSIVYENVDQKIYISVDKSKAGEYNLITFK